MSYYSYPYRRNKTPPAHRDLPQIPRGKGRIELLAWITAPVPEAIRSAITGGDRKKAKSARKRLKKTLEWLDVAFGQGMVSPEIYEQQKTEIERLQGIDRRAQRAREQANRDRQLQRQAARGVRQQMAKPRARVSEIEAEEFLAARVEPLHPEEVLDRMARLPAYTFSHRGQVAYLINLSPHSIAFAAQYPRDPSQKIIEMARSGAYLRETKPDIWYRYGGPMAPFGPSPVAKGHRQKLGPLNVYVPRSRDKLHILFGNPDLPKRFDDWDSWGYFPQPEVVAEVFPHTYFFVSSMTECIEDYYNTFVFPEKTKVHPQVTDPDRPPGSPTKIINSFELSDGVCHVHFV